MTVLWMVVGSLITIGVGFAARNVIVPWFIRPVLKHANDVFVDLVTVVVLSPEVQADLRSATEEVVAKEARVIMVEVRSLGERVRRLERSTTSLDNRVRDAVNDRGRRGDADTAT